MQNKTVTNIERIIAKIDNDFNPDNSDWIPRVGAWCIDAMSMLDCLCTKRTKKTIAVKNRIAYVGCPINDMNIKVYDSNGCEIEEANNKKCGCNHPSTGEVEQSTTTKISTAVSRYEANDPIAKAPDYLLAETLNDKEWPGRYRINEFNYANGQQNINKNYVIIRSDKIELNFDTKCITLEYDTIETTQTQFGYELPVIPNNGILIEALTYYCMYKMLCRGYKHPVFNLAASQYGTNPYYLWTQLKDEAKRSVIANRVDTDEEISKMFRSAFYIDTFDPRR